MHLHQAVDCGAFLFFYKIVRRAAREYEEPEGVGCMGATRFVVGCTVPDRLHCKTCHLIFECNPKIELSSRIVKFQKYVSVKPHITVCRHARIVPYETSYLWF